MATTAGGVRRGAAVPLAGVGLLLALTACTGSAEPGAPGSATPGSTGGQSASPAPPGKFRTLPEPCGAVPRSVLARLLPGTVAASPSPQDGSQGTDPRTANGSGKATLTHDTDRRAGCEWTAQTDTWTRYLHVDFERVVSYDTSVSDEQQAQEQYTRATDALGTRSGSASAAPLAESAGPTESGPSAAPDGPSGSGTPSGSGKPPKGADGDSSSGSPSARLISGIGDEAFLDERLKANAAEPHRMVVIVFRKANVIVKVELKEWPPEDGPLPSSGTMQVNAHHVAQELAKRFSEQ